MLFFGSCFVLQCIKRLSPDYASSSIVLFLCGTEQTGERLAHRFRSHLQHWQLLQQHPGRCGGRCLYGAADRDLLKAIESKAETPCPDMHTEALVYYPATKDEELQRTTSAAAAEAGPRASSSAGRPGGAAPSPPAPGPRSAQRPGGAPRRRQRRQGLDRATATTRNRKHRHSFIKGAC